MDQTVREIEDHIDRTRDRLGENLQELENRVEAATDWREHFRTRPFVVLGAVCVAGAILGGAVGSNPRRRGLARPVGSVGSDARPSRSRVDAEAQVLELWDNVKGALLGVAAVRVKDYIAELIPGFDEQYRYTEQRRSSRSA